MQESRRNRKGREQKSLQQNQTTHARDNGFYFFVPGVDPYLSARGASAARATPL
jgi:hypothetical protein